MPEHAMSALEQYSSDLFAPEDAVLRAIRAELPQRGIPNIMINPLEGRLLQVLLRSIAARRVLEIGALAGYSGIWLARALAPGGQLITLEREPLHSATAREFYARAGLAERVTLREGAALDLLPALAAEAPFDAIFIDADKPNQAEYVRLAIPLLRQGGLLLVDNSYRHGAVLTASEDPGALAVQEANRILASDPRLYATIIPTSDGLAVAVKQLSQQHAAHY